MRSLVVLLWLFVQCNADAFDGKLLRILPLGDSITWGFLSSDYNGYRNVLYEYLTNSSSKVNLVGSQKSGYMMDNNHEGHIGAPISQIITYAPAGLIDEPNVVLLMAGTNDLVSNPLNEDKSQAINRLASLISEVVNYKTANAIPLDPTVLIAKIIHNSDPEGDAQIQTFNSQIDGLIATQFAENKVVSVDMSVIQASQTQDGTHPNDAAYAQMAGIWYQGLLGIGARGWPDVAFGVQPGDPVAAGVTIPNEGILNRSLEIVGGWWQAICARSSR